VRVNGRGALGELAVRIAVAAALLSFVHLTSAAAQEANPTSQRQATTSEINGLVRQVLADRIAAKDLPDWGLLRGAKRIAIRSDPVRLPIGKDALPGLEGHELELITGEEARARAERTPANVPFIAIERLQIQGDTASLWIGVGFTMPPDPKLVKMCCCSRGLDYRRAADGWVFVQWSDIMRCS
jgi:hypothetical protein